MTYDQTAHPIKAVTRPNRIPAITLRPLLAWPMPDATATRTTTMSAWLVAVRSASTSSYSGTSSLAARIMRFTKLADDVDSIAIGHTSERRKPCPEVDQRRSAYAMASSALHSRRSPLDHADWFVAHAPRS